MPGQRSGERSRSAIPGYEHEIILLYVLPPPPVQPGASVLNALDSCIIYLFLKSHYMPKDKEPNSVLP